MGEQPPTPWDEPNSNSDQDDHRLFNLGKSLERIERSDNTVVYYDPESDGGKAWIVVGQPDEVEVEA